MNFVGTYFREQFNTLVVPDYSFRPVLPVLLPSDAIAGKKIVSASNFS